MILDYKVPQLYQMTGSTIISDVLHVLQEKNERSKVTYFVVNSPFFPNFITQNTSMGIFFCSMNSNDWQKTCFLCVIKDLKENRPPKKAFTIV